MREIKFRAWDKVNNEWLEATDIDRRLVIYTYPDNTFDFADLGEDDLIKDMEDIVLCQYTGLKDKNGKDIYEGDIIEDILTAEKQVIEFHGNTFTLVGYKSRFFFTVFRSDEKQIIGNIYDNPELLEGER